MISLIVTKFCKKEKKRERDKIFRSNSSQSKNGNPRIIYAVDWKLVPWGYIQMPLTFIDDYHLLITMCK